MPTLVAGEESQVACDGVLENGDGHYHALMCGKRVGHRMNAFRGWDSKDIDLLG